MLFVGSKNSLSSQVDFEEDKLITLISTILNKQGTKEIRELPYSFSNKTIKISFRDNTQVVVKVSIRESRYKRLVTECNLIEKLLKETHLPLPKVLYTDFSQEQFEYPFAIYSFLKGTNLVNAITKIKDKNKLGEELAQVVLQIHKISFDDPQFSLAKSPKSSSWKELVKEICDTGLEVLKEQKYKKVDDIEKYIDENQKLIKEPSVYKLIHRDLQPQNIHWDVKANKISGIFDFEAAMSGDKLFEFVFLELNLFKAYPEVRRSFYTHYSKHASLPENFQEVLKFYGVIRDLIFYPRNISYGEIDRANITLKSIESVIFKG